MFDVRRSRVERGGKQTKRKVEAGRSRVEAGLKDSRSGVEEMSKRD